MPQSIVGQVRDSSKQNRVSTVPEQNTEEDKEEEEDLMERIKYIFNDSEKEDVEVMNRDEPEQKPAPFSNFQQ